jgi:hypothetical protein
MMTGVFACASASGLHYPACLGAGTTSQSLAFTLGVYRREWRRRQFNRFNGGVLLKQACGASFNTLRRDSCTRRHTDKLR